MRCQIALADGDAILATAQLADGSKPTAALVPAIRDLCRHLGWSLRELDLVCVDIGPGSYTGLRVGLTCAKTLAFAVGAPLATTGSLDTVAQNIPSDEHILEIAFDAARGQVFSERFGRVTSESESHRAGPGPARHNPSINLSTPACAADSAATCGSTAAVGDGVRWTSMEPVQIVGAEEWARGLDRSALVAGPALVKYRDLVAASPRVADESLWWPRATNVIQLGLQQFRCGELPSYWMLEPRYLRLSAAEEKKTSPRPT